MAMKKIEILKYNDRRFLDDIKRVRDVGILTERGCFLKVKKKDVFRMAEYTKIDYTISDKIYVVTRDVMIIR